MLKHLCLLLFCLTTTHVCQAQELTVKSMEAASFDVSASTEERKDVNNNPCGLVKVRLAAVGAVFEGNVIQPVEYRVGEYWVYMTEGSYQLRIKHPNFVPLDVNFHDYNIKGIVPKSTYNLTLLMSQTSAQPVDDGMRYLIINTKPKNATVYVDGTMQTLTDGSVSVRLPIGQHSFRVEAAGYHTKEGTVQLQEAKKVETIELVSAQATVKVTSATAGATLYVNDVLKGSLPWNGQFNEGNYLFEARKEGYRSQRVNVTLKEDEQRTVEIPTLQPIYGVLSVNYQPVGASIVVDGKKLGETPEDFRNILVGSHTVEISKSGYSSEKKTINIAEGKTLSLTGSLKVLASNNASHTANNTSSNSQNSQASSSNANNQPAAPGSPADIRFEKTTHHFGTFSESNPIVKCTFTFTNVGGQPLKINQVISSCGCAVADFTKGQVMPGQKGTIQVTYNGSGKFPGHFKKSLTVRTNGKVEMTRLYIEGDMTGK